MSSTSAATSSDPCRNVEPTLQLIELAEHLLRAQASLEQLLAQTLEEDDLLSFLPQRVKCAICETIDRLKIGKDSEARKVLICSCEKSSGWRKLVIALGVLILILVSVGLCRGQEIVDAPQPKPQFLDKKNVVILVASAASIAMDGLSTQYFQRWSYRELNPIAKPLVKTRLGDSLYMGGGYAAMVSGMYIAHRHGWHKLERIAPMALTAAETYWAIHNFSRKPVIAPTPSVPAPPAYVAY
ncbi:MAG TPA: hypothetical protein VGN44_12285 [Candidatus Angelobacter sp.]|jgi:hypothetical protein